MHECMTAALLPVPQWDFRRFSPGPYCQMAGIGVKSPPEMAATTAFRIYSKQRIPTFTFGGCLPPQQPPVGANHYSPHHYSPPQQPEGAR
jgi:hypothetical protein